MKQTEYLMQKAVFQILVLNETAFPFLKYVNASANGGKRHVAVAAKMKASGSKRGIPDIQIPFMSICNKFPFGWIEMKTPGGRLTPEQKDFMAFVENEGHFTAVAYGCDECLDIIENYCGVKLQR